MNQYECHPNDGTPSFLARSSVKLTAETITDLGTIVPSTARGEFRPLPRAWDLALREETGFPPPAPGPSNGLHEARAVTRTRHAWLTKSPPHVFEGLYSYAATEAAAILDAHLEAGGSYESFEAVTGLTVDRSERRLLEPGAEVRREAEEAEATRLAEKARAEANARNDATMAAANRQTCKDKGVIVISANHGAPDPAIVEGAKPWRVTDQVREWRIPEVPGWTAAERLPNYLGVRTYSGDDVVPCTYGEWSLPVPEWTQISVLDHNRRVQFVPLCTETRPPWSSAGHASARVFLEEHAKHFSALISWQREHVRECIVRALGVRPDIATQMEIDVTQGAARLEGLASRRNWDRSATIEDVALPALAPGRREELGAEYMRFATAGRVPWLCLVPTFSEKVTDAWKDLIAPIREWFGSRSAASSEELATLVGVPQDSPELHAASKASGLERRRITLQDGTRAYRWIKP